MIHELVGIVTILNMSNTFSMVVSSKCYIIVTPYNFLKVVTIKLVTRVFVTFKISVTINISDRY